MVKTGDEKKKIDFYVRCVSLFIIFSIFFLTLAYASSSTTGRMENIMASVKPIGDARITGILASSTTNGGISSAEDYNVSNIYGTLSLPNSDSTVTYKISVTVFLASEMKITSITGLDSHLEYELTDYSIGYPLCDANNQCNYGATSEFYLTIKYKQGEYDGVNTTFPYNLVFTFDEVNYKARVGNDYYDTLQQAVDAVPVNTRTTVTLIKNSSELVTIPADKNIVFDLQNNFLSNDGVKNVVVNYGTLEINNGTITSDTSQGAINNESTGHLLVSGGRIIATGTRQAIYNNGGTLEITGSAYLSATTNQRGTVQNLASGNVLITGGTIVSTRYSAVVNINNLTIGVKDGTPDPDSPIIQGYINGVNTTTGFNFYDGIIKGKTASVNDETLISDIETSCDLLHQTESIGGYSYNTLSLAEVVKVYFYPNGGTVGEGYRELRKGTAVGNLPTPVYTDYEFDGWFTDPVNGTEVTSSSIINADTDLYAHWTHISQIIVAEMNGTSYHTLQLAIADVPKNNTLTTITLLRNTSEALTIAANQNIVFDLRNYTISNSGNSPVIANSGTLTITNGRITSNTRQGAINNVAGAVLYVSGGSIEATGIRQAIYNNGGTLYISGTAYLSSTTSERATVQNLSSGHVYITGGTIVSTGFNAIENTATMTIGSKDGNINSSSPIIQGYNYGVNNTSVLNFYDGTIKGITDSINGVVDDLEQNATRIYGTETINGNTYQTVHLQ
ncbi:MAG: InlB B-repeat-containing protein [Bacilli bacterium]|nr:InlB B-repeat-containing protein [Bacilli bacterium]